MISSHTQLKNLRLDKGLTQEQLAFIIGTSKTYIGSIESGNISKVSIKTLLCYCHFFDISYNELFKLFDGIIDKSSWTKRQEEVALIKKGINPATFKNRTTYVW